MRVRSAARAAAPLKQALSHLTGPATRRSFATSTRLDARYGFIGLGRMGFPMAKNLRSKIPKSDTLIIHDVNPAVCEKFEKEVGSVTLAKNVREVAENADTIITVLPQPFHVESVFQQMLRPPTLRTEAEVKSERLFIDCSTIDIKSSAGVANATHSSSQGRFVDAPMSGGVVGAEAGKLTFMIGAAQELVARATEVLSMMGKRVMHMGPQTSGLKGKLANNYLLAINNIATAEAMNMGVRSGLDPKLLAEMINSSTGKCWPSEANNPVPGVSENAPAGRGYEGGFGTALMVKDLDLAIQGMSQYKITPRLGTPALQIYKDAENNEKLKGKDFSVVYQLLHDQ